VNIKDIFCWLFRTTKDEQLIYPYYWHGTNTIFHEFDLNLCGTCEGNGHGKGVYLADYKLDAAKYAEYANFKNGGDRILCLTLLAAPAKSVIDAETHLCDVPSSIIKRIKKRVSITHLHDHMTFQELICQLRDILDKEKEFSVLKEAGINAITNFWDDGLANKAMVTRVIDPSYLQIVHHERQTEIVPNLVHPRVTELVWRVV
jgi:hypothetical protein